jgi:putative endonuclease
MRSLYVYILASTSRVLYVGVTNDIHRRVAEHRAGLSSFSRRYRVRRLVYLEVIPGPRTAIAREKQIKKWTRARRVALIVSLNPRWLDFAKGWPTRDELLRSGDHSTYHPTTITAGAGT